MEEASWPALSASWLPGAAEEAGEEAAGALWGREEEGRGRRGVREERGGRRGMGNKERGIGGGEWE